MRGCTGGDAEGESATRERAQNTTESTRKARGKSGNAPEGLRGEGWRCACEAMTFADSPISGRFQLEAFLLNSKGYISMDFLEPGLRSLIHNLLKLRHRFCVVAYQELSCDFF